MPKVSIVVPVYYNAESLPLLNERLAQMAASVPAYEFEFIFVDDGSGDDSFVVLQEWAHRDERIRVIQLSRNFGSNAAILAGLSYAQSECCIIIAADLQDPPELIPQMLHAWEEDNKLVLAARRKRADPWGTKFFATIFNRLFRKFVFPDFPPNGFDFMLLDQCIVKTLVSLHEKNSYLFGQAMWVGFRRTIIYYDRQERKHGHSRWTALKKIKYFIDAFVAFSYLPLRLASLLGIFCAGLGFCYALLVIGLRLTLGFEISGWASLMVVILLTSGAQLLLGGILGEYIWRVLDETRHRPPFIVASTVNIEQKTDI